MILQELHGASCNQLTASLHSETPSVELWKLLAPPWHCFSAALLNPYHRIALTASLIAQWTNKWSNNQLHYTYSSIQWANT